MDSFAYMGYCRTIELSRTATSADIYAAVVTAFTPDYPMEGWRMLFRQAIGQGTDGILRLSKCSSNSLTLHDLHQ